MLWLYLLGVVTFLGIVVRRLLRRQNPLIDDVFSKRVAIDHVHDGVAWVNAGGRMDYLNPALARMLDATPEQIQGKSWLEIFARRDRARVEAAFSQMLLAGKASLEANLIDSHDRLSRRNLLLIAVHDHKTRLAGHHCIVQDRVLEDEIGLANLACGLSASR